MKDIEITEKDYTIFFRKKLYHYTEILLAKCFNFIINIDSGVIVCDISKTNKKSVYEFIKLSYKNFSESPMEELRRNNFYEQLDGIYERLNMNAASHAKSKLPYYDKFYEHQKDAINECFYKQHNFLALDMGLGKTIISASLSRVHGIKRTIILCPAAVKWNWYRDLVKGFGFNELYFTILDSSKYRTIRAFQERFVICNYDMVGSFIKELISNGDVGHIILDEAHNLKNHNSLRSKNVRLLIDAFPNAYITLLSGTPVKNRVNDVFNYLKMIGHELGSSVKKFLDEYTVKTSGRGGERVTGGKNLQDLYIKLSNFMIRKTKEECLDLPGKIYMQHRFEIDDYRDEYDKIIKELSEQKEISSLTGNLHSLNIITSKAKIKGIIELADEIIETGKKVVIFGSYTKPIEELEAHYANKCVKITGSVDAYMRDQLVQKFQNDPECMVFLGNMIAAGVGINLTNASDVIFINFPFTPAELYQATDRLDRIGQKSCVNVHYTFCDDSIDEYIYDIIVDKEKDINALIDQGKEVMYRENITELLMKRLLKRDDLHDNIPAGQVEETEAIQPAIEKSENSNAFPTIPTVAERSVPANVTDELVDKTWAALKEKNAPEKNIFQRKMEEAEKSKLESPFD